MIALIDNTTGALVAVVESTEGRAVGGLTQVALPASYDPVGPSHVRSENAWIINPALAVAANRVQQQQLLLASDLPPIDERPAQERDPWLKYRQALRDVNLSAPVWPVRPDLQVLSVQRVVPGRSVRGGVHCLRSVRVAGGFGSQCIDSSALTTVAGAAGRLDLTLLCPVETEVVDRLEIEVMTLAVGAQARIALINSVASGAPGAMIATSGVLDCATLGFKAWAPAMPIELPRGGIYWVAVQTSGLAVLKAIPLSALQPLGMPATGTAVPTLKRSAIAPFAAGMPAVLPALTDTSAVATYVRLRFA